MAGEIFFAASKKFCAAEKILSRRKNFVPPRKF